MQVLAYVHKPARIRQRESKVERAALCILLQHSAMMQNGSTKLRIPSLFPSFRV